MKTKLVLCAISTFMIGKNLIEFEFDVYDRVLCDCEHCGRLTKQEYKLLETKEEEIWYYRVCTKDIFPLHEVNDTRLHKILIKIGRPKNDINKYTTEINIQSITHKHMFTSR